MSEKEEIKFDTKIEYDERQKILTVHHDHTKDGVVNKQSRQFDESSIFKMVSFELQDKKILKEAIEKVTEDISNFEKQMVEKKIESVELTPEQLKLKEDLTALQKFEQFTTNNNKLQTLKDQLEMYEKNLKEKNAILEEIKVKASNLNLQQLFK